MKHSFLFANELTIFVFYSFYAGDDYAQNCKIKNSRAELFENTHVEVNAFKSIKTRNTLSRRPMLYYSNGKYSTFFLSNLGKGKILGNF
ncbi:hypothetical protein SAMN05444380_1124 [Thermophagus xiamenensis]|uniref:Uncharacterized protein n=1 Tax=Thermophagus xiamenensis TaxID=385682 RepID=A0A1I2AUL7_9BACT|nr:hypothetical protein SAMN05444380_1124 [Thermophagus xiamenensis]